MINSRYGLSKRIKLVGIGDQHIAIVKMIKSRIIQKDAPGIIKIAESIRVVDPLMKISLKCSSNICSKTITLLAKNKIKVIVVDY